MACQLQQIRNIDIRSYLFLRDRFYGMKSGIIAQINGEMAA